MFRFLLLTTVLGFLLLFASPVQAADAVVGDGTPASCTEPNFDAALNTVQTSGSGTITFNCGGAATITFMAEKSITATVTIDGGDNITLNGGNTTRLFAAAGGATLNLTNITLRNGFNATLGGGAILNNGILSLDGVTIRDSLVDPGVSGGAILSYGPVTIHNSLIENNTGGSVGGLFVLGEAADATITSSTFRNNRTTNANYGLGGAITLWDGADLTLTDSTLEQNQALKGGGIYTESDTSYIVIVSSILRMNTANIHGGAVAAGDVVNASSGGNVSIDDSVIADNITGGDGGGIYNARSPLQINNSTISGNHGYVGGGVYSYSTVTTIQSSTINNNTGINGEGGGIETAGGQLTLTNVTLSGNTADWGGGLNSTANGIAYAKVYMKYVTFYGNVGEKGGSSVLESSVYGGNITAQDVIFQSSSGSNCHGNIVSQGFNLASDDSCNLIGAGDLQNTDAQLGPLRDNGGPTLTHLPKLGSPALDSGQCVSAGDKDQRGVSRPQGGICDKGSVERTPGDMDNFFVYFPMLVK